MQRNIIVVTAAYGQQNVRNAGGQRALLPIIAQAGADGVEIRRELLSAHELTQLPELAENIKKHQLDTYYSVPEYLFIAPGMVNPQLSLFQDEAQQLNATAIKFSLGAGAGDLSLETLSQIFRQSPVPILIENDQTDGGKLSPMLNYFSQYQNIPGIKGMTFDMANWLWVDESPIKAIAALSTYVSYCHVKAATQYLGQWRAIELAQAGNEWREIVKQLPAGVPLGIEFPLEGSDLAAVTHDYVELLRHA